MNPLSEHQVELRLDQTTIGKGPVTCGVPWPRGALTETTQLALMDRHSRRVALQARALDYWPDRSVRWVLLDWQAESGADPFILAVSSSEPVPSTSPVLVVGRDESVAIETGAAQFELSTGHDFPFRSVRITNQPALDLERSRFVVEDESRRTYLPRIARLTIEEQGPLRAVIRLQGELTAAASFPLANFDARLHFFAGSAVVRFELALHNPRKADHPGGLWDLGNGGSIFIRDAALSLALPQESGSPSLYCSGEMAAPFEQLEGALEIYQDSSGGENWKSSNHLNREHIVPHAFRGYRIKARGVDSNGLRATPAVHVTRHHCFLGATMPSFWQNFPKAIELDGSTLVLRLFPQQYGDVHELQGGERKTHHFSILFGAADRAAAEQTLNWHRQDVRALANPAWYCGTGAIPYLTPKEEDPNTAYLQLVDAAIEGPDTFDHKREVIDEYGWRHFGDIYGDHEAVFHKGPTPLVSHYNNQYDAIAGLAYQFLRSGDRRWFRHMDELACHVADIDIYHTDQDKSAYNHGLFWHTFHYVDADTGTHRSYPKKAKVCGGGPSNEQNYTTGLMFHYFLTGRAASREAALALARWVIDMDDGAKTVFRWLAGSSTGMASKSRTPSYHGPGRGAANSIAALIDGNRLSGDPEFLAKAEQLIRRCVHPEDEVPRRNLLDAENRWFYTMFLQSLGRYLDYKAERGERDFMYGYARVSLLHYTRWMAENEYPYLEKPEILEYPTETWAAQDMRKSEIFEYAAKHAIGAERGRFLERSEFFFQSSVQTLASMPTRTLARPIVLLLSNGFMHAWFQRNPDVSAPGPDQETADYGVPEDFVPQKERALRRAKLLAGSGIIVAALVFAYLVSLLFR